MCKAGGPYCPKTPSERAARCAKNAEQEVEKILKYGAVIQQRVAEGRVPGKRNLESLENARRRLAERYQENLGNMVQDIAQDSQWRKKLDKMEEKSDVKQKEVWDQVREALGVCEAREPAKWRKLLARDYKEEVEKITAACGTLDNDHDKVVVIMVNLAKLIGLEDSVKNFLRTRKYYTTHLNSRKDEEFAVKSGSHIEGGKKSARKQAKPKGAEGLEASS